MVTLHLLKLLENQGFGAIDTDLFWEEITLDSDGNALDGIWIQSRGTPVTRYSVTHQAFDIYSRYKNKIMGAQKLEAILEYLQSAYSEVCSLPEVPPYSTDQYTNVRITPTSGVENAGIDENNRVVRVISGLIQYERSS